MTFKGFCKILHCIYSYFVYRSCISHKVRFAPVQSNLLFSLPALCDIQMKKNQYSFLQRLGFLF